MRIKQPELRTEFCKISPSMQIPAHEHADEWELVLILRGSGTRTIGDESVRFHSGDVVLAPPGIRHEWRFSDDNTDSDGKTSNLVFFLDNNWMKRMTRALPEFGDAISPIISARCSVVPSKTTKARISRLLQEAYANREPFRTLRVIEAMSMLTSRAKLTSHASKRTVESSERERFAVFVTCNYMKRISLEAAAREAGMCRSAFCVAFKNRMGLTFTEYVNSVRISRACALLRQTSKSIYEIASEVGFSDLPYFCRKFRQCMSLTPSAWRHATTHQP